MKKQTKNLLIFIIPSYFSQASFLGGAAAESDPAAQWDQRQAGPTEGREQPAAHQVSGHRVADGMTFW